MADGEGEETLEGLRAEVVRVRDETLAQLRQAEGERDGAQARVTELEAASASTAGELVAARAEVQALKDAAARVPAGAGERQEVDLSGMTAAEKIAHGLSLRGGGS